MVSNAKDIRYVETQTARARVQGAEFKAKVAQDAPKGEAWRDRRASGAA
jgi:hypothetical protein